MYIFGIWEETKGPRKKTTQTWGEHTNFTQWPWQKIIFFSLQCYNEMTLNSIFFEGLLYSQLEGI